MRKTQVQNMLITLFVVGMTTVNNAASAATPPATRSTTGAGATVDLSGLQNAGNQVCALLNQISTHMLVGVVAFVMFVAGAFMMWMKIRGGMALAITAFVGYFLVRQSVAIARGLGITGC